MNTSAWYLRKPFGIAVCICTSRSSGLPWLTNAFVRFNGESPETLACSYRWTNDGFLPSTNTDLLGDHVNSSGRLFWQIACITTYTCACSNIIGTNPSQEDDDVLEELGKEEYVLQTLIQRVNPSFIGADDP
jgi:hypothetical protein